MTPIPPPPPPAPGPPPPGFRPSPTLDELFPPIDPKPSFRERHGRRLIIVGACVAAIVVVAVVRQVRQPSTASDVSLGYLVSTSRTGRIVCVAFGPERSGSYVEQSRQGG